MKQYSPDIFQLVPRSQLSEQHFQMHPIWSEYYDYDEREEIISWGIDPTWLTNELEKIHDENDHGVYPILRPSPFPERMRLFVKATFKTPGGNRLTGSIVNENAYAITIFHRGNLFPFCQHVRDLAVEEHNRLLKALDMKEESIFPLSYVTSFKGHDDKEIEGVFNPFSNKA